MMTPSELMQYEFKTAGRNAYKAEDVDSFLGTVLVNYEKLYRENGELVKRISLLADRLETYKKDEVDIKQAVLSAQKAADIIVRDAEESVADAKQEAEAILAAAKGEADIIKSDAERQAVADSELLLSMARDKAEDIMNKAKEKAHSILIAANDSASNTVGAATRTITSESIHYDMLKKEVSEFRASILAQYKAHIEMISKLPELAIEEASKIENVSIENQDTVSDIVEKIENDEIEASTEKLDDVLEVVDDLNYDEAAVESAPEEVNTFFENDLSESPEETEIVTEEPVSSETLVDETPETEINEDNDPADIPISKRFSINATDFDFEGFNDFEEPQKDESIEKADDQSDNSIESEIAPSTEEANNDDNNFDLDSNFFDSIENIDVEETQNKDKKPRLGFFRKKK